MSDPNRSKGILYNSAGDVLKKLGIKGVGLERFRRLATDTKYLKLVAGAFLGTRDDALYQNRTGDPSNLIQMISVEDLFKSLDALDKAGVHQKHCEQLLGDENYFLKIVDAFLSD